MTVILYKTRALKLRTINKLTNIKPVRINILMKNTLAYLATCQRRRRKSFVPVDTWSCLATAWKAKRRLSTLVNSNLASLLSDGSKPSGEGGRWS